MFPTLELLLNKQIAAQLPLFTLRPVCEGGFAALVRVVFLFLMARGALAVGKPQLRVIARGW